MVQKSMGLRVDTYERLSRQKRAGESYSDTIDRLIDQLQPPTTVRDLFGILSEAEGAALAQAVAAARRDWERPDPWSDTT